MAMKKLQFGVTFLIPALVFLLRNPAGLDASQSAQEPLPKAEQILDQYVEAIGGLPVLEKIHNRVTKGTMEIAGTDIKISVVLYQERPDRAYSIVDSPATGKRESGTDGEVVWQMSAATGPQVLTGKEKASALHMNTFDRLVYWRKVFRDVETTGLDDVAGKPCYKVVVTPPDLPPQTLYFDKETHLVVRASVVTESPSGTIPADTYLSDYQATDGVLMPRKTVTKISGQERVSILESIEQNVDLPPDRFALPEAIKALIKK